MTTSNISILDAPAPVTVFPVIRERTACGGGLADVNMQVWDGRTYIGDFPPVTHQIPGPIWIAPYYTDQYPYIDPYPYTKPLEPVERFHRLIEKLTPPPTKFRTTEVGNTYFLALDIPGVRRGDVELTVEGYVVTVKATRRDLDQGLVETITLDQSYDVDPEQIDAWHEDGVITIAFPKKSGLSVKIGIR